MKIDRKRWSFAVGLAAGLLMILADMPVAADPGSGSRQQTSRVQKSGSSSSSSSSSSSTKSSSARSSSTRSSSGSSARSGGQTRPSRGDAGRRSARVDRADNHADGMKDAAGSKHGYREYGDRGQRGHRGRHGYRGYYGYPHAGWSIGYYPYWGSRFWGYGPYAYGHYGYGYGYGSPVRVYSAAADGLGALDFDVRPEKAEIYLNGQRIGVADDYDGFPTYLWLDEGTYDVVIYREGYETIARQYSIFPGVIIDVEDHMAEGTAVKPEDLPATSTAQRDRRMRGESERAERIAREDERWRDRADDYRRRKADENEGWDARSEPSRLFLSVAPHDASVYLDGRVLGTGGDLGKLHAGLLVDAGEHEIEVVRPNYRSKTIEFEVEEAGEVRLDIELEPDDD